MRKLYVDNVRWITIVLVVIYHVIYMFNSILTQGTIGPFYEVQWWDGIQYVLYPWFMLILFVVAGMSARYYLEAHTEKEFKRSRTTKLLLPSTAGLLIFHWITGYYNMAIAHAFDTMGAVPKGILFFIMCMSGTGVLWFIQLLWLYSMLLLAVRKIDKDRLYQRCAKMPAWGVILMAFPLWVAAQLLNAPVIVVYRLGLYFVAFLVGYFVLSHDEVMERLTKWWYAFAIVAVAMAVAYVALYFGQDYADGAGRDNLLAIAYGWIMSLAMLTCMKHWFDKENKYTKFMSANSWGIYIFHYTWIAMAAYYMHQAGTVPAGAQYLICLIVGFVGSYLVAQIISRIPIIRTLVMGIKKTK